MGSDVNAASYSGAPQHNTHILTVVSMLSRRDGERLSFGAFPPPSLGAKSMLIHVQCGHTRHDALSDCLNRFVTNIHKCISCKYIQEKKLLTVAELSSVTQSLADILRLNGSAFQ